MNQLVNPVLLHKLLTLEDFLGQSILGQDAPLSEITLLLRRSFCGCRYPNRPVCSMLLMGPTGVGKTETVNLFSQHLFGPDKFVRFDMSEFQNQSALGLLTGNNVGERGLLGKYLDRSGGSGTLLFDEIEKAHPLVMDIFLQILSAGRFTLATGETLDLTNYVVVATTNIGSFVLMSMRRTDRESVEKNALKAGLSEMRLETLGRFDIRCVFNKLSWVDMNRIARLHTSNASVILNNQGHEISVDQNVPEYVFKEGYSEHFGARPIEQAAMRVLGDLVSAKMLENGGHPVEGQVTYDRRTNRCSLK